jgi:hypothetical protein
VIIRRYNRHGTLVDPALARDELLHDYTPFRMDCAYWAKESWRPHNIEGVRSTKVEYRDGKCKTVAWTEQDWEKRKAYLLKSDRRWCSSIAMPERASRLSFTVEHLDMMRIREAVEERGEEYPPKGIAGNPWGVFITFGTMLVVTDDETDARVNAGAGA